MRGLWKQLAFDRIIDSASEIPVSEIHVVALESGQYRGWVSTLSALLESSVVLLWPYQLASGYVETRTNTDPGPVGAFVVLVAKRISCFCAETHRDFRAAAIMFRKGLNRNGPNA